MSSREVVEIRPSGIVSFNPATGEVLREFRRDSEEAIDQKLQRAIDTFQTYRKTSFAERSRLMLRAGEILADKKNALAEMMTREMGKPLRAAVQEAEKCATACRFYAENAERFLAEEEAKSNATRSFVRFQPLGPVLAVMPWNFPFWQVFRFAAPALMAGNVGLLKHASNVPQCALAIEAIFRTAGFPEGAFQTLMIGSDKVARVIEDRRVVAVTLTGSVGAGSKVAAVAGKQIKKSVLELGGSDPFIVMPSADFEAAVSTAVQARVINNGQSCIAAKRFIVHEKIADEFERRFVERMAALKVGDPMDPLTDVGPLATADVLDDLEQQVKKTVQMGARLLLGGKRLNLPGNFYAPTVLADIPPKSPAAIEELFGPVASLYRVKNMEEAIRVANDSEFGLGSSAWTNDPGEREMFIEEIEAGMAFINGMVASDPRIPFGGVKQSGYGRELSYFGIREFVNIKTVSIYEQRENRSKTE
ncbi:MAG TPA: NAD-dependent succinate-semialdehyde dehydrogenase [Candidatus Angelobacter sp.]|nr:NAD-dependent succinate-semialdehyde dehydrogenase [Candidatus Angelobacter sp.]